MFAFGLLLSKTFILYIAEFIYIPIAAIFIILRHTVNVTGGLLNVVKVQRFKGGFLRAYSMLKGKIANLNPKRKQTNIVIL